VTHKDQPSLTKPCDMLHHGERAANKYGGCSVSRTCDRTKMTTLCVSRQFSPTDLHLTYTTCIWSLRWG